MSASRSRTRKMRYWSSRNKVRTAGTCLSHEREEGGGGLVLIARTRIPSFDNCDTSFSACKLIPPYGGGNGATIQTDGLGWCTTVTSPLQRLRTYVFPCEPTLTRLYQERSTQYTAYLRGRNTETDTFRHSRCHPLLEMSIHLYPESHILRYRCLHRSKRHGVAHGCRVSTTHGPLPLGTQDGRLPPSSICH